MIDPANTIATTIDAALLDAALDWHLRQDTLTDAQWPAFIDWLESSPAHAAAYDHVVMADHALVDVAPAFAAPIVLSAPIRFTPRRRWAIGGTALAAGLAALVVPNMLPLTDSAYLVTTKPGERRTITLADATRIELNGGTSLRLDHANLRIATLERGEATFHVRHDAGTPFTLASGAREVRDVGTVFNVVRTGPRFEVAVAEGSVIVDPRTTQATLTPGDSFVMREDRGTTQVGRLAPAQIGGWRQDRLSFADAQLSSVAAALERRYAVSITLAGDLSQRPFTGMVALSGAAERDVPHIAALIGATVRRDGNRWTLTPETPR